MRDIALVVEIRETDVDPPLGGIEYAQDIIDKMDIERTARADPSFKRFVEAVSQKFQMWRG